MEHTPSSPADTPPASPPRAGSDRPLMLMWADLKENSPDDLLRIPPVSIIRYRDLLERAWGWERLLPQIHGTVDWHEFKSYLEEYFQFNAAKVATGKDALHAAAKQCIEFEKRLIRSCGLRLNLEAFSVSSQIQKRAKGIIRSDGEKPAAAAAALLCIAKEAELIYTLLTRKLNFSGMVTLSNEVRRSASNLMLCKGPESAVAAGAMVGVAIEAQMIPDSVYSDSNSLDMDYLECQYMRESIATDLTRLELELACPAGSDTTEKPKGTDGGLDSEGSNSMENPRNQMNGQDNGKGNEKMNKNLSNQTDSAEEVREDNEEAKAAGEDMLKDFEDGTKGEAFARSKGSGKEADIGDT